MQPRREETGLWHESTLQVTDLLREKWLTDGFDFYFDSILLFCEHVQPCFILLSSSVAQSSQIPVGPFTCSDTDWKLLLVMGDHLSQLDGPHGLEHSCHIRFHTLNWGVKTGNFAVSD